MVSNLNICCCVPSVARLSLAISETFAQLYLLRNLYDCVLIALGKVLVLNS